SWAASSGPIRRKLPPSKWRRMPIALARTAGVKRNVLAPKDHEHRTAGAFSYRVYAALNSQLTMAGLRAGHPARARLRGGWTGLAIHRARGRGLTGWQGQSPAMVSLELHSALIVRDPHAMPIHHVPTLPAREQKDKDDERRKD